MKLDFENISAIYQNGKEIKNLKSNNKDIYKKYEDKTEVQQKQYRAIIHSPNINSGELIKIDGSPQKITTKYSVTETSNGNKTKVKTGRTLINSAYDLFTYGAKGEGLSFKSPVIAQELLPTYNSELTSLVYIRYKSTNEICNGFVINDNTIVTSAYGLSTKKGSNSYFDITDSLNDFQIILSDRIEADISYVELVNDLVFIITKDNLSKYNKLKFTMDKQFNKSFGEEVHVLGVKEFTSENIKDNALLSKGYNSSKPEFINILQDDMRTVGTIQGENGDNTLIGAPVFNKDTKEVEGIITTVITDIENTLIVHWFNSPLVNTEFTVIKTKNIFASTFPLQNTSIALERAKSLTTSNETFTRYVGNPLDNKLYSCSAYIKNEFPNNTSSSGSGVVIGNNTVLTNRHVVWEEKSNNIAQAKNIKIMLGLDEGIYRKLYNVTEIIPIDNVDIVILKTSEDMVANSKVIPMKLASELEVKNRSKGDYILKFGYPGSQYVENKPPNMYVSKGVHLYKTEVDTLSREDISFSKVRTYKGMSGSPMINNMNKLIGLHNSGWDDGEYFDNKVTGEHLITGNVRKVILENM